MIAFPVLSVGQDFSVNELDLGFYGAVYSPAYMNDLLVVCSDQKDRLTRTILDEHGTEPVDMYIVDLNDTTLTRRFDERFRTDYNDGPISFNAAGDLFVVSRNQDVEQKKKDIAKTNNHLGLYMSRMTSEGWSDLEPLPFNGDEFNCSHPALSADGEGLWFTSDRPGGQGGYDIWYSERKVSGWTEPTNLGPLVNSGGHELFPSVNGGQLYFSSDRGAFGGLDVYSYALGSMDSVRILDEPINSPGDDFGLITLDGLEHGYMASNRGGSDKILEFTFHYPEFEPCDSIIKRELCYRFAEQNAKALGSVESLIYRWTFNDVSLDGVEVRYCFPGPGDYEITLDVIDTVIGVTYFEEAYYYVTLDYDKQPYIDCPDTVAPGELFALTAERSYLPDMIIDEYYWDFGDGRRAMGINQTHQFDEPGTYLVQVGVLGYQSEMEASDCVYKAVVCSDGFMESLPTVSTDLQYDHTYDSLNPEYQYQNASHQHIELPSDVVNLIEDHELIDDITMDVSYYYTDPGDSNFTVYSVEVFRSDVELPEDHRIFTVLENYEVRLEYLEAEDAYLYVVGSFNELVDAHPTWNQMLELGFDESVIRAFVLDAIDDVPLDMVFVLDNVQFDSDSWELRPNAIKEIQKLIVIMDNFPELSVRIDAHTDATASISHNQVLSERRAGSVAEYMIERGIEASRIESNGYGESRPIDTNETEEGKQNNRRVEFELIRE